MGMTQFLLTATTANDLAATREAFLYLIAIIGCGIGIAGFVKGMLANAKKDGELLAQVKFCNDGICEIKKEITTIREGNSRTTETLTSYGGRIERLEGEVKDAKRRGIL